MNTISDAAPTSAADLTKDSDPLRDLVRSIVSRYDRRYWLECARAERFPSELWRALADAGILGIGVPPEYGGLGLGTTEIIITMEELNRAGVHVGHWQHTSFARASILAHGTDEQKRRFIPPTTTGDLRISLCVTEVDSGTNAANLRTRATASGDGYSIQGQKAFIGGADVSEYYLVVARTTPMDEVEKKHHGLSLFLIDAKTPGISLTKMDLTPPDVSGRFMIYFDDVRVPADTIVGRPGYGLSTLFTTLNVERLIASAWAFGMGYYALEKVVRYVKEREVFNGPIGAYQAVQHPLARTRSQLDAARLMTYYAAAVYDAGGDAAHEAQMAKLLSSDAACAAADAMVQFHGGAAFLRDSDVMPLYEQIRVSRIAPINNEMVLNYIAERMLGLPRSY